MPKIFALVPAYNEAKNIEKVLKKLKILKIEAVVVDDGSKDKTYEIAKKHAKFVLRHERNKGKAEAIKTGLKFLLKNLRFDVVAILDADNAYDPLEIPKFVERIEKGYDFVMGFRDWREVPFRHKLGNLVWRKTFNTLFGTKLLDTNCGFVAMNKKVAKEMYKAVGLDVPKDILVRKGDPLDPERIIAELGERVMVKPAVEGSSYGISLCQGEQEIRAGIERALELDDEVLVEEYLAGSEVTCCVLGRRELEVLPLIEIRPGPSYPFFTYEAKYEPGASEEICPAPLDQDTWERVVDMGKAAHRALRCRVWSRTDMIISDNRIAVLETNTIPGMTPNSLFPKAAKAAGISLSELVDKLVQLALEESADSW